MTDATKIARVNDALLDIKRIAGQSGDHDIDPWALSDLIGGRSLGATGRNASRVLPGGRLSTFRRDQIPFVSREDFIKMRLFR